MINFDNFANENIKKHIPSWLGTPDHLNKQQDDDGYVVIDKFSLYVKDPNKVKYPYLIPKRKNSGLGKLDDPKSFIEYSNNMQSVYTNIEEYNLSRTCM